MRAIALAALLAVAACSGSGGDEPAAIDDVVTVDDVLERLDCRDRLRISQPFGNLITGVRCSFDGREVHVFARTGVGLGRTEESQPNGLADIDRVLGVGNEPTCAWLVVANDWVLLAEDEATADEAAELVGGTIRANRPVRPMASYVAPGGCA